MASKTKIRGITIELGADTSGLDKALKGVNSQLKTTQSALNDVNKLLKLNPGNVTLLQQKQKGLTSAINETKAKLKELKSVQKDAVSPEQWDAVQREIIETENNLKSLTKELKDFGSVGAQQIAAVGKKVSEFGQKLTDIGSKMTTRVTLPIVAGFTAAASAASDYDENINKLEVAFGKYAKEVRDFTDNALEQYGLSKLAASEAAASFGALSKGMGLSEKKAATLSKELTGLSADLASYFNMSNEDAANALTGIFTGETESLKRLGVVMTQVNLEDFAARQGKVYKEMSEAEKVMLRYEYVMEKTADAQGDYARTSDGTANSVKTFKSAIQDLGTVIGSEVLPMVTPLIQGITNLVKKISDLPQPVRRVIVIAGTVVAAIGPVLTAIGSISTGVGALMQMLPGLISAIGPFLSTGAIVVGLIAAAALIIKNWDKIKEVAQKVMKTISAAWDNLRRDMVATFENARSFIVNGWNNLRNGVVNVVSTMRNNIISVFDGIKSRIQTIISSVKDWIVDKFTAAKDGVVKVWNTVTNAIKKPINGIITMINGVIGAVEAAINWILNGLNRIKVSVPSWVPGIGGRTFGFNLGQVRFGRISYLAKGGSIGEGEQAIVGENAPEYLRVVNGRAIVTPIDQSRTDNSIVTINVYAQPGQSAQQIAQEVKRLFMREQEGRLAAYA